MKTRFAAAMQTAMDRMMRAMHSRGNTGHPDADFLAMMVPHHVGAIEMARLVLEYGRDPATRRLAEDIIANQATEIEGMRSRLAALRDPRGHAAIQSFPELGGTRGP